MKIALPLVLLLFVLTSCEDQPNSSDEQFNYSIDQPIEGQIQTAKRLKTYMDEKDYDNAINLFSSKERRNIEKIRDDQNMFNYWCLAWTLDSDKLNRYISNIKKNEANFVFEEGEWKIDEK